MEDERLQQMWEEAWKEYTSISGHDSLDLPQSVDAATLVQTLERQTQARQNWTQEGDDLYKSLKFAGDWAGPVVGLVATLASGVPLSGPAQMVLGALQLTIKAANGVVIYLEQVLRILNHLCALSKRFIHYSKTDLSPEQRGILVKQLVILLKICAISTRQMQDKGTIGITKLWAKSAFKQQDDVPALLEQLEQGIENEFLQNSTETLVAVKQNASRLEYGHRQVEELSRMVTQLVQIHTKQESVWFYNPFNLKGAEKNKNEAISLLSPSDLAQSEFHRHEEALVEGGLGNWIRQDRLYQEFKTGQHSRLLVAGLSGSGKSFLAHNVISDLRQNETAYVGYFFFSRDADKIVTPSRALCTMASHVASDSQTYARYVLENCKPPSALDRLDTAWKLLFANKFIGKAQPLKRPVYLVIDALDALSKTDRAELCSMIQEVGTRTSGLRVVVFGRSEIHEELGKDIATIEVGNAKNGNDITQYVRMKLEKMTILNRLPSETQERIVEAVSTKADGLFVWADLALVDVERKNVSSASSIWTVLKDVPSGLVDALSYSLEQVAASLSPEKLSELNCLLAWVSWVQIPLTLDLLNTFHRLDDTHDGDIVNLRDSLFRYSTIFKLDILDDAWVDDHDFNSNSTPALQRIKSEQTRFEDEICRADPKFVSVTFCHTSVLEYIQSDRRRTIQTAAIGGSRNPIRSSSWAQQKISSCLMKLLMKGPIADPKVKAYAERWWLHHLVKGVPPDSAALEVKEIPGQLYSMLNNDKILPVWVEYIVHNHMNYNTARAIEQILVGGGADAYFKSQTKDAQKWRKSINDHPLVVFSKAMEHCGKTWLKSSPPHVLALSYGTAAIEYHIALRANPASQKRWCVYPKVPHFTTSQIQEAAKDYTGKRDALWKCRVARALEMAQDNGPYNAEQALLKIKGTNIRWEADLALARLFLRKSQWDNAIACAQESLNGLIAISEGEAYCKFAFDCNKLIAECFKQKLKVLPTSDVGYNQHAMMAAEYLRRAVRLQPKDSNLLNEAVCAFHGVTLRLMVEGKAIDAEDFLEDDFSASELDDDDSPDPEQGSSSRHSGVRKSCSELNISKERPNNEQRTLSEDLVSSPKAPSEHRHRLSKSSISNASIFRTMSHGSDREYGSLYGSWKDGSDSVAETEPISSPRFYFDNFDENLNSYVCHSKVMTLLRDLDGASDSNTIVGYKERDGFEYRIDIERDRLYQRLSQVLERNPRLVNIMAFAACRSDYMTWFVELFERAIQFEGQRKRQHQLMFLNTYLGTVLSVYAGKHDDAIHIWQSVVDQKLPSNRKSGVITPVQAEASKHLGRLCISRASSDASRADEYIKIAESLSNSSIGNVPSQVGTERVQTKLYLATWYHNQGDLAKARSLVQEDVLWALAILTDDDPANDFNGFYVLANALRAVQDDRNHLAARHAMRQYGEDDAAISTADKKQKATNNTDAFCSGLCLQEHKQWDNMRLCRSCPNLNLCQNCFRLFKSNDLYLKICNPEHEFLHVPRMKHSFTRGNQVVVDERVVDLEHWVAELRREWQFLDNTAAESTESTSRWRRQSSRLLSSEDVKTERKRDKLWRLFSQDKGKE